MQQRGDKAMPARHGLSAALLTLAGLCCASSALARPGQTRDCTDPLVQAEINACAEDDYRAAEKEMAAVYAQLLAQFREQDRTYAEDEPQYTGAGEQLMQSQSLWAESSGALCAAGSSSFFGGSARPAVHFACLARMARSRTEDLRWLLD